MFHKKSKSLVWTFMRANPPTRGHCLVVEKMLDLAQDKQAEHVVVLSQSHCFPDNPISWELRFRALTELYPKLNVTKNRDLKTPFIALEYYCDLYDHFYPVFGEDRVSDFERKMIDIVTPLGKTSEMHLSGKRRAGSLALIENISATAARNAAYADDFVTFRKIIPPWLSINTTGDIYTEMRKQSNENSRNNHRKKENC